MLQADKGQEPERKRDKVRSLLTGKKKKVKKFSIPDDVENLFSLMDFSHDAKIDEAEFLRSTMHYRSLSKMLTVDLLEDQRNVLRSSLQKQLDELQQKK